jgi:hypothetical protein
MFTGGKMLKEKTPERNLRIVAAVISSVTAFIYFMIGFNIVSVLETSSDQVFGVFAGAAYLLGAFLLLASDRRIILQLGALLQITVVYMYFSMAPIRIPHYEFWGIVLRIAQMAILTALLYLLFRLQSRHVNSH